MTERCERQLLSELLDKDTNVNSYFRTSSKAKFKPVYYVKIHNIDYTNKQNFKTRAMYQLRNGFMDNVMSVF